MTAQRAISVIQNEAACVSRQTCPGCDRRCGQCDLVLDDREILEAYSMAVNALKVYHCEHRRGGVGVKLVQDILKGAVTYG